jgi:hypothetical protein
MHFANSGRLKTVLTLSNAKIISVMFFPDVVERKRHGCSFDNFDQPFKTHSNLLLLFLTRRLLHICSSTSIAFSSK